MKALVKRKLLLIWMGIVLILCGFAYFEYLSLKESLNELTGLISNFPKILKAMFGVSGDLTSALGWYGCMYYWVTMLTNSYAVYLGVSCVAKEQAQGTAEYLFTKPVGRNKVVCAKAVACVCNLLALAVFSGLCNYFTAILPLGGLEQRNAAFTTTLGLFLTGLTLFAITLLASSLTRTYKGAVRIGAGILLLFYGISITAEYLEAPMLYCLTPLKFFDVYTGKFEMNDMDSFEWLLCPVCNSKTRIKLRLDTELKNFPLFCPKCKQETLISVEKFKILVITEPDAQTQSR